MPQLLLHVKKASQTTIHLQSKYQQHLVGTSQEGPVHSKTLQPSAIEQQVATLSTSTKSPSPEVRDLSSVNGQVCSPNLRFLELNHKHDFHRRKNVHSQTAPSLTSTETQTNWDDPLLTKDKCEEQIPASTPPTQSASLPTQSASLTIQPPEPAATPPLLFALVKQQQEQPSATSSPIMLDHTYYIPNETPVQAPPKQVIDETTAVDDEDHDEEDDASDPDYHPSSDESSSSDEEDDSRTNSQRH
ncbi:uncharacterized protein [Amphiura filiformis]|uniref:uncharacterized protein n=1 Tax=Amphiura filiformis TaxID=82378 RepID=UPI003B212205